MTIKKRLARSNIAMFVIPVLAAVVLLLIGVGLALFLLKQVYLPRLGLSMHDLRQAGEQFEQVLSGASTIFGIYAGTVIAALLLAIGLTNFCLTRSLFRHIAQPLDTLTAGVARIRDGDLDTPISYGAADEFKAACDALDEMAARLKASLEEQQAAQQQKQELIAGMSHDLKSPLTSIRAYTEALLDGVAPDEAARQRYLRTIYAKETEIEAMVNRLFAFAKMEASRDPVQPVPLPLRQTMEALAAQEDAPDLEIALEIPPALQILADPTLMQRITANLLTNSRKYAGRTPVHVLISAQVQGDMAEITFADDGVGVPPAQLPRLFDVFYRGDAARTAPGGGSGLGLAVVRRAAEAMGGSVRAENGIAGGLQITLTLPLVKEEPYGKDPDRGR